MTTTQEIRLAIYEENCNRKGELAMDSRTDAHDDPKWDSADVFVCEGTPAELLEIANMREKNARNGGGGTYDRKVAATIRKALS